MPIKRIMNTGSFIPSRLAGCSALQRSLQSSSPNIDWCNFYADNCVHSRFFVLLLCLFVYLLIYYSLYISCLCVFVSICLFITTLISSYFSAWPSHSARLALAISEWLCSPFFSQLFPSYVLTRFVSRAQ